MARPRDKAETRKKEILESFYAVLAEEGLEGASMAKVASRMGIHPSLIVHYFSSKEEMVVALVDHMLAMYEKTFLPRLQEIEDPAKRLEATIDAIFGLDWARLVDAGVFYACYSLSFRNPRVKESFRRMYSRLRELLVEGVAELMEEGVLVRADPGKLADLIISLLEGYDFYRGIMEESIDFDELARFLKQSALAMVRAEGRGSGG
ncbi:MAG: TetR family transcriptional regulator C-terminal domain-containing protein [Actinomycetota bacterium]|nr:TetR family transcriptional regulator C-terminal domain-containing protein [Actinomycetota bacterium]